MTRIKILAVLFALVLCSPAHAGGRGGFGNRFGGRGGFVGGGFRGGVGVGVGVVGVPVVRQQVIVAAPVVVRQRPVRFPRIRAAIRGFRNPGF